MAGLPGYVRAGADQRDEIWNMIYDDRTAVAKTMEDKYKLPFAKP